MKESLFHPYLGWQRNIIMFCCTCMYCISSILSSSGCRGTRIPPGKWCALGSHFFRRGQQRFHPCGWIWWFFKVSNDGIVFVHFKKKTVTSWLGIGWRSLLGGFCFPGFSDWVWCIQLRLTLYLRIDVQYISGVPQMHWQSPPGSLHFLVGNPYKRYWYAS